MLELILMFSVVAEVARLQETDISQKFKVDQNLARVLLTDSLDYGQMFQCRAGTDLRKQITIRFNQHKFQKLNEVAQAQIVSKEVKNCMKKHHI